MIVRRMTGVLRALAFQTNGLLNTESKTKPLGAQYFNLSPSDSFSSTKRSGMEPQRLRTSYLELVWRSQAFSPATTAAMLVAKLPPRGVKNYHG